MLRYKTETRPRLVALYDIRPGNGAGLFLQPRSPHGTHHQSFLVTHCTIPNLSSFEWSSWKTNRTADNTHPPWQRQRRAITQNAKI